MEHVPSQLPGSGISFGFPRFSRFFTIQRRRRATAAMTSAWAGRGDARAALHTFLSYFSEFTGTGVFLGFLRFSWLFTTLENWRKDGPGSSSRPAIALLLQSPLSLLLASLLHIHISYIYIYIYIYTYIHMYMYMCMCICICICVIYIYIYIYMHTHTYIHIYINNYINKTCIYIYLCVCVCVYICICIYIYIYIYTY